VSLSVDRMRVTLAKLKAHQCKWPVHENPKVVGRFLFCGCAQKAGSNYCEKHYAVAYSSEPHRINLGPRR